MIKKLYVLPILLLILSAVFGFIGSNASVFALNSNFSTSAKAMCLMEKDSHRVVGEKNLHLRLPMASTTKIMTALTVLQHCSDIDAFIEIDDSAVGVEGSSIYLRKGEIMKIKDLLYGLMLRSGNDSAVALAINVGGSVQGFADLMNQTAKLIGANNSNFVTPHGLDHKDHYTTAYDLALITSYALSNPIFKEIVSTKTHVVEATNKTEKRYMTNKNRLLSSLNGCCGVKTGFTTKAGRCLVSACERDGLTFVCVVLNCGPMFEESYKMLDNVYLDYQNEKIIDKNREIFNEYIIDDNHGRLYLYTKEDFYYPLTQDEKQYMRLEYNVSFNTAKAGDEVGEIKVFFKNDLIKTIKLYTMNKIDKLIDSKTLEISEILWEEKGNEN